MEPDEFAKAVAASQNNETWLLFPVPVPEEAISKAEALLGVQLPADYKHILHDYGAGDFHYVELLTPAVGSGGGLVGENEELRARGVEGFVAVSPNGCGDYYGFRSIGGRCTPEVYFWDHEVESISDDPVAGSILDFLRDNALVSSTDMRLVATGREHLVIKWWWW
ncbi:SMI1/KNR4 family protein [Pseudomarimonas salicorniae]|uniref:SMI1/KNR4 family protein n=1 Tax=Pseudomarimonas salicorniae TaxID=2933270 RepID=A0ABT0GGI5_9GAMM|nr:SMI1/KNR4 family protein [Lysobacter sp. CAU 1642]MCK7593172.1 SMI1/KNR4 family protein [Lysobacter sp. CAU 1642]